MLAYRKGKIESVRSLSSSNPLLWRCIAIGSSWVVSERGGTAKLRELILVLISVEEGSLG